MTAIKPHLSAAELKQRCETAVQPIAKSHFHALWLLSRGYDIAETAEILSFSTRWVHSLIKRYNEGGPEQLGDQRVHNGTEPTILTRAALEALKQRLEALPDDGGQWTGPKIARWLAQFHGIKSVHDQGGWDALVALGYSIQQPRRAIRRRPCLRTAPGSKKASSRRCRRAAQASERKDRGLGDGRASHRPEADHARGVGAHRRAPDRARAPSLRMALRDGLRRACHRPHRVERLERHLQGLL
jgi:transposase